MEQLSNVKVFSGQQIQFKHQAKTVNCEMTASIFLPPQAALNKVPVLYWLSGLTCTDQNFVTKAGAQQMAAELGMAIVCPANNRYMVFCYAKHLSANLTN